MRFGKIRILTSVLLIFSLLMPQIVLAAAPAGQSTGEPNTVAESVYDTVINAVYQEEDSVAGDTYEDNNYESFPEITVTTLDGQPISNTASITAGTVLAVSVEGDIEKIVITCETGDIKSVQEYVYSPVEHMLVLPGDHKMTVFAGDASGNEGRKILDLHVESPALTFVPDFGTGVIDKDKVYYYRGSGSDSDALSFELSGLAPNSYYGLEFGYLDKNDEFTVSGAVYDGVMHGEETGEGTGTYIFSTPIMNPEDNNMQPLQARLYNEMHLDQPSDPFPIGEGSGDASGGNESYVNVNLPGALAGAGYSTKDLSGEDDLTGISGFYFSNDYGKIEFAGEVDILSYLKAYRQLDAAAISINRGVVALDVENEFLARLAQKDAVVTMYDLKYSSTPGVQVYDENDEELKGVVDTENIDYDSVEGILKFTANHSGEEYFARHEADYAPASENNNNNSGNTGSSNNEDATGPRQDNDNTNTSGDTETGDNIIDLSGDTETDIEVDAGGRTVLTVRLDEQTVIDYTENIEGTEFAVIEVTGAAENYRILIPSGVIYNLAASKVQIEIRTPVADYTVPAKALQKQLEIIAARLGVDPGQVRVSVTIERAGEKQTQEIRKALAAQTGGRMLIQPVEFRIEINAGEKTVEIESFGDTYVKRSLVLPEIKNLTGVFGVVMREGKLHHIPTRFISTKDRVRAELLSRTNSAYTVVANEAGFRDIIGHWAEKDINLMAAGLMVKGRGGGKFIPSGEVTRAEFAAFLMRALGMKEKNTNAGFEDVAPDAWYSGVVTGTVEAGLVSGYPGGKFKPNAKITRQEMAVIISRALEVLGYTGTLKDRMPSDPMAVFSDRMAIDNWAGEFVAVAVQAGIMKGMPGGTFSPDSNATRAESVVVIKRAMEKLGLQ